MIKLEKYEEGESGNQLLSLGVDIIIDQTYNWPTLCVHFFSV